ncbi:hypothetical protein [Maribacter aestuarii]|nr:hypothetical protein [Maribacter aestuarii]
MKYVVLVQTKDGQRQVQVDAPKVDLSLLLSYCMDSLNSLMKA